MASTQHTLEDGPFVPVLDIANIGTLYYNLGTDNPVKSPSTPEVAKITSAIMEERFATLHERKINGRIPESSIERKKAFGSVIRKASGKVPREKLFILLKIQEQENPVLSLASTLNYMELQSVDLYANITVSVVMQSKGAFERNEFKEAWTQLKEEVTAQKDGKRRTHFIGVSSDSETFVAAEPSQTPAINYQQLEAMESSGLTNLVEACGLKNAFFVRLPDIPSDKTIVEGEEEPLELFPDELSPEWYKQILMTHHPGVWQSRLLRRLGSENRQMPNPTQKRKQAENRAAEKAAQAAQAAQKAAQAAEQRKQHQEGWQKTLSQLDEKTEKDKKDKEEKEDTEQERMGWPPEIKQVVGTKVKSFFGWVDEPKKA
ncbi:hypothetical protein CSIM01_06300 [Colletotrichum simmondsii]|uniref:Uncharacterized protein n=1 Tax=Colletotrichum simmondsii TaxID=703756 RepID=A0A135S1E3_9PEZI|nr:hypothetical protein CSIM01_06300 [Colletotrichum simmondsii]